MGLPEVELGTSWGDNPTYKVRGKGFLLHRPPGRTAVDPETGERYDDLLVIHGAERVGEARRWSTTSGCRSSPSTTSTATTPCWCSSRRLGEIEPRRAGRDHHRRLADQGAQVPGEGVPRRWLSPGLGLSSGARRLPPRPRGRKIVLDPARAAALDVLKAVRVDRAYTNLVLPAVIRHYGLEGRDAAFATELASGTIRRRGTYDAILAACIDRPLSKVEAKVLDALRVGTHQLLSMRVPDHAAISTTVDLVRARVSTGAGNFVNAVLRSVSEHDLDEWIEPGHARRARLPDPVRRDRLQPPGVGRRRAARGGRPGRAARAARRRQREPPGHPGRAAGPVDPRGAAGGADAVLAVRRGAGRRRPALGAGRRRGPRRRPGRGVAAGRAWRWPTRRSRAATSCGWTCAPAPAARPALLAALAAERGARLVANERLPAPRRAGAPDPRGRRRAGPGRGRHRRRRRHAGAVPRRRRSTGCWSTRRAPGSARCAAAPRRAGAASPTTCSPW